MNILCVEERSERVHTVGGGGLLDQIGTRSSARRLCEGNVAVQCRWNRHCPDEANPPTRTGLATLNAAVCDDELNYPATANPGGDLASPWLVPEFPNWPGIIGRFVFQHDIATCLLVASWRLHLSMRHLSLSSAGYRIGPPFPSAADE